MLEFAELFVDPAFLEGAADLDLLAVERAGAGLSLLGLELRELRCALLLLVDKGNSDLLFDLRERLSGILIAFELG